MQLSRCLETVVDAARLAGIPERTLREWVAAGRLTTARARGVVHVDPLEVVQLSRLRGAGGRLPRKDKRALVQPR
jgi:hypothetical protein